MPASWSVGPVELVGATPAPTPPPPPPPPPHLVTRRVCIELKTLVH